jgi:transposase
LITVHYAKIQPYKEAAMKQGMIAVWEEASQLRKLMQQQSDSRLRTRLHLLYLLRTGVVTNRAQAAQFLGLGRNTVGQWLRQYERGGLPALLQVGQAPGKASSLPAEVIAQMRAKLAEPRGCASFRELWRWVEQTYHLQTTYFVIWYTATHLLGARLAVARPTHLKKSPTPKQVFAPRSRTGSARQP